MPAALPDEDSPTIAASMPDGTPWPRITLVTPSYNQGEFIEETIQSVLSQNYPNLEYFIIDGGSDDGTVDIIRKYEDQLAGWVSEPDRGPADAINKGLAWATGEWFNWLNSDDVLMPGALHALARLSNLVPDEEWISGTRLEFRDRFFGTVTAGWKILPSLIALGSGFLPQDATFIRRRFLENHKILLDSSLQNVFDTVLYRQLLEISPPIITSVVFSAMRRHDDQRSANLDIRIAETRRVVEPYLKRLPLINRLLISLMRTRIQLFVKLFTLATVRLGLLPRSRSWHVCMYNESNDSFTVHEARKLLTRQ